MEATVRRAFTILKRGEIRLKYASYGQINFQAKARSSNWVDIWISFKEESLEWECNAVGGGFGCVMNIEEKVKPFCSHTKAVYLWLVKNGVKINDFDNGVDVVRKLIK